MDLKVHVKHTHTRTHDTHTHARTHGREELMQPNLKMEEEQRNRLSEAVHNFKHLPESATRKFLT